MTVRFYSSTAPEKQLVGSITSGQTTAVLSDTIGLPTSYPYTLALDYETLGEELIQVNSAAGTTLTSITRGIDGTSASSHSAGARVRHTSSARDFSDSRNHENSATNIHGLGVGEEIVGTDKVQTLTNKTLVNATGTLRNVDINVVPPNVVNFTNNPAGAASIPWVDFTNGTDKHIEITGNGNIRILNNAAIDAATNTRRLTILMQDGTTERFHIDTGGMATALPRSGTIAANGGFKVIDPGDNTLRKAIQIRNPADTADRFVAYAGGHVDIVSSDPNVVPLDVFGATAQASSYMRVMTDSATTLVQIDNGGQIEARQRLFVTNDGSTGSVVSQVRGGAGQTANLSQWQNNAAGILARVKADGTSDWTNTVDTTGIVVASGGWSVSAQVAVIKAGTACLNLSLTRTGADIPALAGGNIADVPVGTIAAAYRPAVALAVNTLVTAGTDGVGTGSIRLNASTGDLTLVTWSTGGSLLTGNVLQMTFTYPLDFA